MISVAKNLGYSSQDRGTNILAPFVKIFDLKQECLSFKLVSINILNRKASISTKAFYLDDIHLNLKDVN
jgi:hypothetical protein